MSSIKIRSLHIDNETEIRVLISHPMENGRNRDSLSGELIAAHYLEELSVKLNETQVMTINMAGSISKNPFFSFRLKNLTSGDKISIRWLDNRQQSDTAELIIEKP
jgi:sulfur-oxidizing protein SoxZ